MKIDKSDLFVYCFMAGCSLIIVAITLIAAFALK